MINLLLMIFLHIVDGYYSQGILATMKQKNWWEQNYPEKLYKYDYLCALFMHSFSWAFMIMIPTMFNNCFIWWLFLINIAIHFIVDHLKANLKKINLITDQLIHIIQVVITWLICFVI